MPQINFNPLGTQGPQGFFEGYTQGQQMQMEQLKLDQLRQDREELMQLRAQLKAAGQNDDPTEFFKTLIKTGNPDYMSKGYEGLQRYNEIQRAEKLLGAEFGTPGPTNALAAGAAPATAGAPTGGLAGMTFGGQVGPAPAGLKVSPEDKAYQQAADQWMMGGMQGPAPTRAGAAPANALAPAPGAEAAPANAMVAAPDRAQELRRKIMQYRSVNDPRLKAMAEVYEAELKELTKPQVVSPGATLFVGGQPKFTAAPSPTELQRNYDFARSQGFKGSLFDYERQLKEAGRAPAQPSAPVAVVDPATGKQIFVSREEALRNRMAPASAMEGLTPKEIQKREAALPQAKASVTGFETKTDEYIKDLEKLRDDPGLAQITGAIYGRTPSVSREGSRAQALYNKIFAKGGFQALQDLREASKTGGALGNVSNQEGERLERSIVGGLDRTQNIADVKAGINDLIESLKVSKARVRNTFDETYQYKTERPGAGPAPDPLGIR